MGALSRQFRKLHAAIGLSRSHHVQRGVDCRPAQVTLLILHRIGVGCPAEQTQEHRLQHVLGIRRVAGDPVRCAEDQTVVGPKGPIEFVRNRDRRFLCQ